MKCENCGKEMIKAGALTKKEEQDWIFIKTKEDTISQALSPETIKGMEFKDGEVFEYFKACYEAKAESEFLRFLFFRDLKARLKIPANENMWLDDSTEGIDVFVHPKD